MHNFRPPKILWDKRLNPNYPEAYYCFLESNGQLVATVTDEEGTWSAALDADRGPARRYRTLEHAKAAVIDCLSR